MPTEHFRYTEIIKNSKERIEKLFSTIFSRKVMGDDLDGPIKIDVD